MSTAPTCGLHGPWSKSLNTDLPLPIGRCQIIHANLLQSLQGRFGRNRPLPSKTGLRITDHESRISGSGISRLGHKDDESRRTSNNEYKRIPIHETNHEPRITTIRLVLHPGIEPRVASGSPGLCVCIILKR